MSADVRHELGRMVDDARGEVEAAVVKLDALELLRDLAWSIDREVWDLDDIERELSTVDAGRWRAALRTVAELLDDEPDPDPDNQT